MVATRARPARGRSAGRVLSAVWLGCLTGASCVPRAQWEDASSELACDLRQRGWRDYHAAFDAAARASASDDGGERAAARGVLARALLDRTSNVSDVLSCNVGVIAGYYLTARLASSRVVDSLGALGADGGQGGLAYRLLQLALVFIFTLRNANRIPDGPGAAWGVTEHSIIPAIMQLRRTEDELTRQRLARAVPIAPSFRDPDLRIAIVSICAYPPDHPIALKDLTPKNRDAYAQRHGYALRMHLEPPLLGAPDLGIQHAKVAAVLAYLQSGDFDWVAWLDCDSIIMNMDRTLDSIIYQYAQSSFQAAAQAEGGRSAGVAPVCGSVDLSGAWLDSWAPPETAAIRVRQDARSGRVVASAPQFGVATGRRVGAGAPGSEGDLLELDFGEAGTLRGLVRAEAGVAARLEWENGAVWAREALGCREPCHSPECAGALDPHKDLLITEEGWGLSSANWLIRRSRWSMDFLHAALTAAHVEMKLFGDQDAMIFHLMNRQALEAASLAEASMSDPLDRHAAVVPQFELNAYDALNALTMDCDAFVEGDLLVTFPQCKDAEGCNDVFNLAAEFGLDPDRPPEGPHAGAWWRRSEGAPRWRRYRRGSTPALRVFGPRPLVREAFLRERGEAGG